jgi:phosphohistidine swiveling domain-containing protein
MEDGEQNSFAGKFESYLNIDPASDKSLTITIEKVFSKFNFDIRNQVIVQKMISNSTCSGVAISHDLKTGFPYIVVNYDDMSGLTDTVTGGTGDHKSVFLHHSIDLAQIKSERIKKVVSALRSIQKITGENFLDIEFCIDASGQFYLLQARRISLAVRNRWYPNSTIASKSKIKNLSKQIKELLDYNPLAVGHGNILCNMSDWNPAEMIGKKPRKLSYSLYSNLITDDVWAIARSQMGYRKYKGGSLMVSMSGYPFIDVRASLNSFLPDRLDKNICEKLVTLQLERLKNNPIFHDKLEFDIAITSVDFSAEESFDKFYGHQFTKNEKFLFLEKLNATTKKCFMLDKNSSMVWAESQIEKLDSYNKENKLFKITDIPEILSNLKVTGTLPFSILARHGFIAEAFLRSAIKNKILSKETVENLKKNIMTITSQMANDYNNCLDRNISYDDLILKYGHLRPGSYDITSLRYDQRPEIFQQNSSLRESFSPRHFSFNKGELSRLGNAFKMIEMPGLQHSFLDYCKRAIAGREYAKFVFTRTLSDLLELIAAWGSKNNISRHALANCNLNEFLKEAENQKLKDLVLSSINKNLNYRHTKNNILGFFISKPEDALIILFQRAAANFTTSLTVQGDVAVLKGGYDDAVDVTDKIVCIENADPGYDWLFMSKIKGLITKFGGSNSHMAIRCIEFNIPAAIGCGETLFESVSQSKIIELDCEQKLIVIVK